MNLPFPLAPRASHLRKLVLACGNTMRQDDGVAWHIAAALEQAAFLPEGAIVATHQFLPEHCELISHADSVAFVDCSAVAAPGQVQSVPVFPAPQLPRILTHHLDPAALLRMTLDLYGRVPIKAVAVTVGGAHFDLGDDLSSIVRAAIPAALEAVRNVLA